MKLAKPKGTIDDLIKKYGVSGNTKPTATKSDNKPTSSTKPTSTKSDKGKQNNNSASSVDDLIKKYKTGKSTTSTKPTTSGKTPFATISKKNTTKKATDYSSAVKYLQDKGYQGASSIMTQSEWRRRNKTGTYQDYLDSTISKYESGKASTEAYMPRFEKHDADYWKKRYEEEVERIKSEHPNDFAFPVGAHATAIVEEEMKREEYLLKYQDKTYDDNFWGQFAASFRAGDIAEKSSKAKEDYWSTEDKSDLEYVQQLNILAGRLQKNNEDVLNRDDATLPDVSMDFAGYLPQFINRAVPQAVGGGIGAIGGGLIGGLVTSETGGFGAVPGAKYGAKIGATVASGYDSYESMKANAYFDLLELGADEETARAAANDEAVLGAITEMGDTWFSLTKFGYGAVLNLIGKGAVKETAKSGLKKLAGILLKYGINIEQERMEEGFQGATSVANRRRVYNEITSKADKEIGQYGKGNIDLYDRPVYKNDDGTISTVDSVTFRVDDKFVVLPTIVRDENGKAKRLESDEEIFKHYLNTGEHLGEFKTAEEANAYANKLHLAQDYYYSDNKDEYTDNGLWGLAKDAGKVLVGVDFGTEDEETEAEIKEQKRAGGVIAAIMGLPGTAFDVGATTYIETQNAKSRKVVDAVISSGLETNSESEAHKKAEAVKAKIDAGETISKEELVEVAVATEKEKQTATPDTLEQAAMDVVNEKNKSTPLYERLEAQSRNNEPITVADAKKVTGFGDRGAELVTKNANVDGATFYETVAEVKPSYFAGFNNPDMDIKKVAHTFTSQAQEDAYTAGQQDAIMQNAVAKENAKSATVYDGIFTENEYTKNWSKATKKMVSTVAKHFGMDISAVDRIIASVTIENGVETEHEANASHYDGKMEISNNKTAEKLIHALVMHESGHRMEQFATDEWNELCSFLYERAERLGRRVELGISQGMLFDDVKAEHDNAGISLSTKGYIGEVAVRELETIFSSPEEFNSFVSEIESNQQVKSAWGKFVQWLSELIEDLKRAWSQRKMTAEEKASIKELERIKELYAKAYLATRDAVAERAKEQSADTNSTKNLEIKINEEYNGNENYSLKSKYNEYNTIGMQWAYSSSTQIGDKKVLYNPYKKKYVLAEATKDGLGFIELKSGTYKQMREDEKFYESNKQGEFSDDERAIDTAIYNFEVRQNDNTWDNVDVGNRGKGIQNAEVSEGKSNNNGTTNSNSSDGNLKKSFSLKDSEYQKAIENGDTETASKLIEEAAEKAFSNSKVRDENGKLKLVYHGRVSDFTVFDRKFANIEGDFGKGYYFTSNEYDVDANYANEEGPDLKNKISRLAERLEWEDEYADLSYDERKEIARQRLVTSEPSTITAYLNMENPVYITSDQKGTFLEFNEAYDEEYDEFGEPEGLFVDFIEALNNNAREYSTFGNVDFNFLYEHVYDDGGMFASDVVKVIKNNISDEVSDENGDVAINEVIRLAFEEIGFDGIIDTSVYYRFRNMDGMDSGTTHYIVFNSNQIKSADIETYDNEGKPIPLSERFNEASDDIRYSLKDSEGKTLTKEQAEYFKDSKVRDENGNLLVVYHGSPAKFTVFNHNKINTHGNAHGRGFYFTSRKSFAEGYKQEGGQLLKGYLNIVNPLSEDKVTIKKADLLKLIKATCKEQAQEYVRDEGYDSVSDALRDTWISNYVDTYGTSIENAYREASDIIYRGNTNDVEMVAELTNAGAGTENTLRLVHDILGYDGVIYENEEGHNEFVSLVSNQFKSVDNIKPTSNPDINFSLKGTNDINAKDRKELLDVIEHLKGEFEVTKFAKADPKKLAKMTRDILKEYSSKADFDETYKAIDELYGYMANGEGSNVAWDEVYSRAYNIARTIAENAVVVDDSMYQSYKHLRDYLRTTPMKFTEYDSVPSSYENFNDFRRYNMGRLKFTKDGMSIDSVYQELANIYPEFFSEDEYGSADQLERMIDVLDELQPMEINPFDRQIEQVSMQIANDLTSRFFDIPQAKPTFADKAERRVTEERIRGGKKVEAVRQQRDEKIKKLIETQREKTKTQLDKLRQQRDAKVEKEKAKRRDAISKMSESQKAKVLRARILRHTSDLNKKLVNPTDNQHIPYELQGAVAKLLEHINLESNYSYDPESHSYKKNDEGLPTKRTQAFNDLKKVYADIASSIVVDPDLLGENGLLSDVISLADKRIVDMTSSELEKVWQTIRAIEASVSTANKVFSEGKFATILEVAEALRAYNEGKRNKAEFKGIIGKGKKLATLDMLTPETYLHYLGSAGDSIFRMMRDAQDKHISIMKEVADFTRKELKDVNVNKLEKTIHTVKLGGEDVKLTTAQIMELYVLMKRDQAREHILIGGILPDVAKSKGLKLITKTNPIRNISIGEITNAISKLTDEQIKIADKLQKYVSSVLSEYGNEASMQVYNYEKFTEENYWTIRTNKQEIQSDIDKDTAVTSVANKGMTKATKPHANTSVRIGSIFDTFASHSSDMATYAAWLGTSEDVNRIRNFVFWEDGARTGTVKGILDTVHGIHGSQYLEKLLTDIAIGVKGTDNLNPFDKLVGHYKAASVGANIRVIIQQPTAMIRALDMISPIYLAEGAVRPLNGWKKAKKYAPIAQWKDWGHFDINTGRQMKDVLFDNASLLEKTKQVGMWGASTADSLAWGQLWNAVEAETKAKHKELEVGSDAYYETVAKRFTEIVDHTQVVDGILQRSQIMRSPDALTKMATSFMGEPTKQYNMAVVALHDAISNNGDARKKAVKRLGRTAITLAVAGIINACAQSIIDALRDDDKEKDYWEKWLTAFKGDGEDTKLINSNIGDTVNPLNYVPFAKDIISIMQGYDVKRMDTETITKTFNAVTNMYKAVAGTGKYTIAEASAQLFAEIARMYGVPVANVKRDVKSATMSVAIETDNYLMQYRMEKAMLNINYAGNSKNFMDILFNAYNNDREAYEFIYNDMLDSGYEADKIQNGMETRMKKAEGVKEATDLSKRYMTPDDEKQYDSSLSKVKSSQVWKSASSTQRKEAEATLYNFLTSTTEDMENTRAEARRHGVDETEYTLWKLAIEMADQPKGQKGSGSYDYKEKAEAINSLNLDDREIAYFFGKGLTESGKEELNEVLNEGIDVQDYVNFKAAVSDMKADKNAKGKSIPNSKKKKVVRYLNSAGLTEEEWYYFYYEIMNYKK